MVASHVKPSVPSVEPMQGVAGSSFASAPGALASMAGTGALVIIGIGATRGRLAIGFVILALVFGLLEWARPVHRYPMFRPGWATDVAHFFATGLLGTIGMLALLIVPVVILRRSGITSWNPVGQLPVPAQFPVVLLVAEISGYWGHRLSHAIPWWWRLHAVHHSSTRMDWLASPRQHPLDKALSEAFRALPLVALGVSRGMFGAFLGVAALQAIYIHANVRVRFPIVRHLVATPEFHHWHHALEPAAVGKNFAGEFPWMDRIFGTFHLPDRWPAAYGITDDVPQRGYWAQFAAPFRATPSL